MTQAMVRYVRAIGINLRFDPFLTPFRFGWAAPSLRPSKR